MMADMKSSSVRVSLALQVIGLVFGIIGAIIIWSFKAKLDSLDYIAFTAGLLAVLLMIVSTLMKPLNNLRSVAAAQVVMLTAILTVTGASYDVVNYDKGTAGSAILILGLWIASLGLVDWAAFSGAAKGVQVGNVPTLVGLVAIVVTLIGCFLCWGFDGKMRDKYKSVSGDALYVGQVAFLNVLIFAVVLIMKSMDRAYTITLFLSGGLIIASLVFATDSDHTALPQKDQGIAIAGGVFVWIGNLLQILAIAVLPVFMGGNAKTAPSNSSNSHNNLAQQQQQAPVHRPPPA